MAGDEPGPCLHPAGDASGVPGGRRGVAGGGRHVDPEPPAHRASSELGTHEPRDMVAGLCRAGRARGTGHLRATRLARHDGRPRSWLGRCHRGGNRGRRGDRGAGRWQLARRKDDVVDDVTDRGDVAGAASRRGSGIRRRGGRRQRGAADQAEERGQRRHPTGRERESHRAGIGSPARLGCSPAARGGGRGAGADRRRSGRPRAGIVSHGHLSRRHPRARHPRARHRVPAAAASPRPGPP